VFDPALTTARDRIRFALQDVSDSAPLIPDTTLDALVDLWGEAEGGAQAADALASRYQNKPGRVALPGGLTVAWADRVAGWRETANRLRAYGPAGTGTLNATAGVVGVGSVAYAPDPYAFADDEATG
jgi:hypothetical protein